MSTNTTVKGKVTKERKKSTNPWRPAWDIPAHAEELVKAAQLLGDTEISDPADFEDSGYTEERKGPSKIAFKILDQVLDRFISSTSAIELGEVLNLSSKGSTRAGQEDARANRSTLCHR